MFILLNNLWDKINKNYSFNIWLRKKINNTLDIIENLLYFNLKKTTEKKKNTIKKILLFAYGTTGDIAIFSSFTKYLKILYPASKIHYIVNNTDKIKYIASLDKNLDKIIPINIPRFFNFSIINQIKKKYPEYDLFVYLNLYPNLRYLMPYIKFIEMPYFLFKSKPNNIPIPKLYLDFKIQPKKIILINLDMITLNFDKNYLESEQMEEIVLFLTSKFKKYKFVFNNYLNLTKIKKIKNLKNFNGNYKKLVKIATSAKIIISSRNGLCDVIAASVKEKPIFIIYPNFLFPGKNGVQFDYLYGMKDIGYPNKIQEVVFDKKKDKISNLKQKIKKFIEDNYEN